MSDHLRTQPLRYQYTLTTAPPDCETTGFPGQSTSLAPSSQCAVPQSSFRGVKRHMKMTERGRPYNISHHFRSKASVARVQGASDENCPAASFACPGEDSLEYAEGLALAGSSCSSRTGVPSLQMPLADSLQIGGGHPTLHPSFQIGSLTTPQESLALSLLPSIAVAAKLAENQPSSAPAAPASVVPLPAPGRLVVHSPQQDERNKLADLLHDYLQTNEEPIIGSPDNPFPSADDLGIKGISILSAFIEHVDMETFTCTFCGDIQTDIEDSLTHQRNFLQYCVDLRP